MDNYPRGSEWRKWDLHLHTPGTKLNDRFQLAEGDVWDSYCEKLETSDVSAFGITDYFSVDGYFKFIEKFKALYPQSRKVFFPNIELRSTDVVNSAREEVNIHLLFNPTVTKEKIEEFLRHLETSKTVSGGKHVTAAELSSVRDYEEATVSREQIEHALEKVFGDKVDLSDYLLIFTASNNDGLRTETEVVAGKRRGVKRKAVITDELDKFSHGFFGSSNNTEYFLGVNRLESDEETYPKPVVSGSDAHSLTDIDNWLGKLVLQDGKTLKQPTWIKSNPNYEGLRQIIYEPADRIFIGEEPGIEVRVRTNPRRYLKSLYINHVDGYAGRHGTWFEDEEISLNKELVAIIGNKGSGKSAITDIIGLIGNSHNQRYRGSSGKEEELFSFLNSEKFLKGGCAASYYGVLNWHSGEPDRKNLDSEVDEELPDNVEYLPQKYLEKICANIEDDEFRHKLNEVIFGYVESKDQYGAKSLDELVGYLTNQIREDIENAKDALHQDNENVVKIERKLSVDYKREIDERAKLRDEEVHANQQIIPVEVPIPTQGDDVAKQSAAELSTIDAQLATLNEAIQRLRAEQTSITRQVEDLRQLKQTTERHVSSLSGLRTRYDELLKDSGISFDDVVRLSINYEKYDAYIKSRDQRRDEIASLLRSEADIDKLGMAATEKEQATAVSLVIQSSLLDGKKRAIVDRLDQPNRAYQAYLSEMSQWEARQEELVGIDPTPEAGTLTWLREEMRKISAVYPGDLISARESRQATSRQLFDKRKGLISFYDSIKRSIDTEITKYGEALGDYSISIEASLRLDPQFFDEFFKFINQAVKGSFHGSEEGKTLLKRLIETVHDWKSGDAVFAGIQKILDHLDVDIREGISATENARDIFKQMKQGRDPIDFYDFLFGFEYLHTKYDLKVDGKDLSELSPGERGGLLLIFYLMLDRRDVPLIIDQPEDNLDNKSVYEILVRFLKQAKRRRQIIIVTHNPNLAVVADAEQIVHVSIDKKSKNEFSFYSGAIEDPQINKRVIDILEGTLPAFDNRRLKYRRQYKRHPT